MSKYNEQTIIDSNLDAGKNVAPSPEVQTRSVGASPRARKKKISEVQGLKKIMKQTLGNMDKGLRP